MKGEKLGKMASDAAVIVPVAGVYTVGTNEILRRTSMPLWARALLSGSVGVGAGFAAGGYAPRIGMGLIVGGGVSALVNGLNAVNMARYRGKVNAPRAALPGTTTTAAGTSTTSTTTNSTTTNATNALPPRRAPESLIPNAPNGSVINLGRR